MNADNFTAQIKNAIIEENTGIYRDLFENTESASDPYWIRALALYNSLDATQRGVFMEVVRQTAIDTVSNVFAVVDGVTQLEGQDGDIRLLCGDDDLTGDLQDSFLQQFE
ncbi:MAG: hypothetical protein JNK90_15900 [Planctomycetaceae bacterium]|nr:hypothetical protein [Planctomycetaceae bacterium]